MYFFKFGAERTFGTFDLVHLIVLVVFIIVVSLVFIKRNKFEEIENKDKISYIFAGVLLFLDFSFYVWKWINGQQPHFPIPMHICSWATYLVSLSLILRKDFLFQISIYYGLTGGLLSLLVPEFGGYSYDHMRFYQFFLLHTMIFALPLYQYFAYRIKLNYKYIYYTIFIMWGQAVIAIGVNNLTAIWTGEVGNGMFVNEPPVGLPGILAHPIVYLPIFSILFIALWHGFYALLTSKLVLNKSDQL